MPKTTKTTAAAPKAAEKKVEEVKKVEAPKAEVKAPVAKKAAAPKAAEKKAPAAKKAPAKKAAPAKKPAAKKPAAKKAVAPKFVIQAAGSETTYEDVVKKVTAAFKGDVKSMDIYVKAEEAKAYYVINGDVTGDVDLF